MFALGMFEVLIIAFIGILVCVVPLVFLFVVSRATRRPDGAGESGPD
jgi:hypothetical protein